LADMGAFLKTGEKRSDELLRHCEWSVQSRHSGAMRSIEPGISRFRVWC
jgi:hypothetical protein